MSENQGKMKSEEKKAVDYSELAKQMSKSEPEWVKLSLPTNVVPDEDNVNVSEMEDRWFYGGREIRLLNVATGKVVKPSIHFFLPFVNNEYFRNEKKSDGYYGYTERVSDVVKDWYIHRFCKGNRYYVINGKEVGSRFSDIFDMLITPNPVDEFFNEELVEYGSILTKDEIRIKDLQLITLDIDYNYKEYFPKVLEILDKYLNVKERKNIIAYETASEKIRIYLGVNAKDSDGRRNLPEAVMLGKLLISRINYLLKKELDISVDYSFVRNLNHLVFVEGSWVASKYDPILQNEPISIVKYPKETVFDVVSILDKGQIRYAPKEVGETLFTRIPIFEYKDFVVDLFKEEYGKDFDGNIYEMLCYELFDAPIPEYAEESNSNRLVLFSKEFKDRFYNLPQLEKLEDSDSIGEYFHTARLLNVKDTFFSLPISNVVNSYYYKSIKDNMPDKSDTGSLYRYLITAPTFLKLKMRKFIARKKTRSGRSRDKDRFQTVIMPVVQTFVDVFGIDLSVKMKEAIANQVKAILEAHSDAPKEDLLEDIEKALKYAKSNNIARDVDTDFIERVSAQKLEMMERVVDFLGMIQRQLIGKYVDGYWYVSREELETKLNLNSNSAFYRFKKVLNTLNSYGVIAIQEVRAKSGRGRAKVVGFAIKRIINPLLLLYHIRKSVNAGKYYAGVLEFDFNSILYSMIYENDVSNPDVEIQNVLVSEKALLKRLEEIEVDNKEILEKVIKFAYDKRLIFDIITKSLDKYFEEFGYWGRLRGRPRYSAVLNALQDDAFYLFVFDNLMKDIWEDNTCREIINGDTYLNFIDYSKFMYVPSTIIIPKKKGFDRMLDIYHLKLLKRISDDYGYNDVYHFLSKKVRLIQNLFKEKSVRVVISLDSIDYWKDKYAKIIKPYFSQLANEVELVFDEDEYIYQDKEITKFVYDKVYEITGNSYFIFDTFEGGVDVYVSKLGGVFLRFKSSSTYQNYKDALEGKDLRTKEDENIHNYLVDIVDAIKEKLNATFVEFASPDISLDDLHILTLRSNWNK